MGIHRLCWGVLHNRVLKDISKRRTPVESDPTLMCELLVGLGEVDVVGINDDGKGPLWVTVRSRSSRPVCQGCAGPVWSKGDRPVRLVDLPVFGRPVRLWWRKRRWMCPDRTCEGGSFVEQDSSVAPERGLLTSRAGRWSTVQVGRLGRTVSEVAVELGCDWHTVNNEVIRWGEALLESDTGRYGSVEAVGVDQRPCFGGRADGALSGGAPLLSM